MESTTFTVDAALLRELGERLIGRSYIALAELVKNSYDADATNCTIEFRADAIIITDNGHGIAEQEFHDYWMRIGTTHKTDKVTSQRLGRPMTGSKGLGRLSVQFLADEMTLESTSVAQPSRQLYAFVDWSGIQRGTDIDTVNVLWEMRSAQPQYTPGTRIVLKVLRSTWNTDDIAKLGQQVWMLQPPYRRSDRWSDGTLQDFYVDINAPAIERAREAFGRFYDALFSNWKARIRGRLVDGRSVGSATPNRATVSVEFKAGYPRYVATSNSFTEHVTLPLDPRKSTDAAIDRVDFELLIFKPSGRQPAGLSVQDMRAYLHDFGNVSVYDGGFRLPYYGASQDWLNIAVDQGRRLVSSALLPSRLHIGARYLLDLPAPGRIFGFVEIDTSHERSVVETLDAGPGSWLQISAGRDRLADNVAFDQLRDLVRFSLDLYANRYCLLRLRVAEQARAKSPAASRYYSRALATLEDSRAELTETAYQALRHELVAARNMAAVEEEASERRAEMLAPLATAGMTALALNHELTRELVLLDRARAGLRQIATHPEPSELTAVAGDLDTAASRIGALCQLFDPLLSAEDRQATDRLRVGGVVEQVVDGFRPLMGRVDFDASGIPEGLRFPVGAFAEWSAMLQNVLTNAWNAMLDAERAAISFQGGRGPGPREWLRVSDTGVGLAVPLDEASALFEPFERRLEISAANRSISMGGQGLGLAIVRMIARGRAAEVAFVRPAAGFATALEISWKGAPE